MRAGEAKLRRIREDSWMKNMFEENRWQRDDHHHKDDKKMKATT